MDTQTGADKAKAGALKAGQPKPAPAAPKAKHRQRRQHWFVVTAPKTTKVEKHRFASKNELREFLKANIKQQNFVFFGSDGQIVPETLYDVKLP